MSRELDRVLALLDGAKRRGSCWLAKCPAHPDRHPSLSVGVGADGRVLLHCFTGCDPEAIVSAISLRMRDLHPECRGLPRSPYANGRRLWKT